MLLRLDCLQAEDSNGDEICQEDMTDSWQIRSKRD